ncbi:MAG TPA: type II toxin-antitoxin system VapC family toxin [Propionibacteriaceae bacterium]|jgi:ribonuclease VapC
MIIDTSALAAIVFREADRDSYRQAIIQAPRRVISAATYVELSIVVDSRHDPVLSRSLDDLLTSLGIEVADLTADQARIARSAHRDFGRGSGHPARLNLGDCFSYALAKQTDEPLLWKGDDFGHTDVRRA